MQESYLDEESIRHRQQHKAQEEEEQRHRQQEQAAEGGVSDEVCCVCRGGGVYAALGFPFDSSRLHTTNSHTHLHTLCAAGCRLQGPRIGHCARGGVSL